MEKRTGKSNEAMKAIILDRMAKVEYTDTFAFAIRTKGIVQAAIVENASDILPMVTYCERLASKKGEGWNVRMWNAESAFKIIRDYAREIIDLCSVEEFEESYLEAGGNKAIPGYRGEWFERWFVKIVGGERPENRQAKCTETGDVILNGEHIQLKLWNASVGNEKTSARFYEEYLKKVA